MLSEASRSSTFRVLPARNDIHRRSAPNDIGEESVTSSKLRNDDGDTQLWYASIIYNNLPQKHTLRSGGCVLKFRGGCPDQMGPELSFCSLCIWNSLRSFCDLHPHLTAGRLDVDRSRSLPQVSTPPGQPCGRGGFSHRDRHSSP